MLDVTLLHPSLSCLRKKGDSFSTLMYLETLTHVSQLAQFTAVKVAATVLSDVSDQWDGFLNLLEAN